MSWPLSVQKVLQAERFSAGRLHHVAQDSRSVTPTTGLAGKKKFLAYHLSFLLQNILRIRTTKTVSKYVWPLGVVKFLKYPLLNVFQQICDL